MRASERSRAATDLPSAQAQTAKGPASRSASVRRRRRSRWCSSPDVVGLDDVPGMIDLGCESGKGSLCGSFVAGEALVAMLNPSGRVATYIDAQLVDVGRFHKP